MASEMFFHHFLEVAQSETRSITVKEGRPGNSFVPVGRYEFVDCYCTDPTCDCRRVLLHVVREGEGIIGVVSYAFDPNAPMRGPFLDPMHPRPSYENDLLAMVRTLLLGDPAYVARLERHYQMIKEKTGGRRAPPPPRVNPAHGRKKPKKRKPPRW